ncbi:hypothetical protein POM88_004214 [Heracleum sosnowskyi]|uniref:Uncharacterized protein n=1 Tax=Heracleum sosnowskyi TaxID=360622 RepID=A0AAD8JJE0_9APIA|nr:hypothetical protein POM88_004214 [Heracleum sosnowskyi]
MGKRNDRCVKEGKSKATNHCNRTISKEKRAICWTSGRLYYDSSLRPVIPGIRMDKQVCLAELAIRLYNIKELTHFAQVNVLKVVASYSGVIDFRITFQAFSPLGVASVFITKVRQFVSANPKIEIMFVRMKHSHSHCKNSQQDEQCLSQVIRTLSADSVNNLAPYLSQLALVMYNIFTLHVKKDAVHDISSLKVVKAIKQHVADESSDQAQLMQGFACRMCFFK